MDEKLVYYLAGVPLLGIAAQFLAFWTRLPSILILLAFGIMLGAFVNPDQLLAEICDSEESIGHKLLFPIVSLSVGVILFEGGLSLRFSELKTAGNAVFRLCVFAAIVTWILTALAAWLVLDLDPKVACLLGAILVVTGPTVVAPLIRYIRPTGRVGSILKWEGIVIDPIGAILAVLVFEYFFHSGSHAQGLHSILTLVLTMATGVLIGGASAFVLTLFLKRYWIPDHLHGVTVLASALAAFAFSNMLQHESGLVTVTVMGIFLANQKQVSIEHIVEFKENLGVFLISCLFIVLGSRLDIAQLWDLSIPGLLFLLLLILAIRPLAVFLSTIGSDLTLPEKTFLSFLAPRGIVAAAVTSVFALQVQIYAATREGDTAVAEAAEKLVPITFLVIVGTVAVYGLGAAPLARSLKLASSNPQGILFAGAQKWVCDLAMIVRDMGFDVAVVDTNYSRIARAKMNGLPAYCSSILSDHLPEHLDFSGIGRMLACTNNDGVNTLAAKEYKHYFGSKNSYQLPPFDADSGIRTTIDRRLRGRGLFGKQWDEEEFYLLYQGGYRFKKTKLTQEFDYVHFRKRYGSEALVLFVVDTNNQLLISTVESPLTPEEGQTVVAFVPPDGTDESSVIESGPTD